MEILVISNSGLNLIFYRVAMSNFEQYFHQVLEVLRKRTLHNVGIIFSSKVGAKILTALALAIVIRNLSKTEYGTIALVQAIVAVSATILLQGYNLGLIKNLATQGVVKNNIVGVALVVTILVSVCIGAILTLLVNFNPQIFGEVNLTLFLPYLFFGVITFSLMNFSLSYFQGSQMFSYSGLLSLSQAVIFLGICLFLLIINGIGVKIILSALVLLPLIPFIAFVYSPRSNRFFESYAFESVYTVIKEYKWYMFYSTLLVLSGQIDVFVMSHFFSLEEVAVYSVAAKLYNIFLIGLYAIHTVILPKFSSLKNPEKLKKMYFNSLKLIIPFAISNVIAVYYFADALIYLFAGEGYQDASAPLLILGVSAGISLVFSPSINILFSLNRIKTIVVATILLVVVLSVGHNIVTKEFGAIGCAATTLLGFAVQNIFMFICSLHALKNVIGDSVYEI